MSRLKIITEPSPILRSRNVKIKAVTEDIKRLICDMVETMKISDGIGLAAPQVGQNIRLITINTGEGALALINPKILWKSFKKETEEEGCLSCPGVYGEIRRAKSIWVLTKNENGKYLFFRAHGLFARVILHETDHLKGILITDKLKK